MPHRPPLLAQIRGRVESSPGTDTVPPMWEAPPWVERKPSTITPDTSQLWKGNSNEHQDLELGRLRQRV